MKSFIIKIIEKYKKICYNVLNIKVDLGENK